MTNEELYQALVKELRRKEDLRRELEKSWQDRREIEKQEECT